MTSKPNLSRVARLRAGSRPSLPGQDPMREEELRIELTLELQPQGRFEQIWIEDIAYRMAMIEVIRAQIAGCRTRMVQDLLNKLQVRADERAEMDGEGKDNWVVPLGPDLSPAESAALQSWSKFGTVPTELTNWLGDPLYAWLLGNLEPVQMQVLRQYQILEQEEVRERDRIIRQFERRRRQQVMDAVKLAEVRGAAGQLDELEVLELEAPVATDDCVFEEIVVEALN